MFNPQLATFVCVADCGSFSQAAEKLYLSSTAVMKQLNALERHLEPKLLERTRRGTVLTPAGEVIYRYARQMFADSDRALRRRGRPPRRPGLPFVWEPPSSIPAGPLWTCGTASAGTSPATSSTSSPMRTTTRDFGRDRRPWERNLTSLSVPATPVSGWTAAIFSLWGSIATASPSPGTPPGGAEGAHPGRAAWGDTDDGEAGDSPFSRPGAGRSGGPSADPY